MRYLTIGAATAAPRRVSALALGARRLGTATPEPTALAILDRSSRPLQESLDAVELELSADQRVRLDEAR